MKVKSLSRVGLFATSWTVVHQALSPWDFPCKSTGVGCHFLLQGIFLTQGSNLGLQHCRQTLLLSETPGKLKRSWGDPINNRYCNLIDRNLFTMDFSVSELQFSSVAQSCLTLHNPMNHSTPGLPVHHQLPEFIQTHAHGVDDAIQPSHLLLSPSPPAPNPSQHQGLFQWVNSSHEVAKALEFQLQHQCVQWTQKTDLLYDGLVGSPCSPRDSQESYPTPQFKSINILALSFLHSPTLTSTHDHWKNHSLDQMDLCWKNNVSAFECAI